MKGGRIFESTPYEVLPMEQTYLRSWALHIALTVASACNRYSRDRAVKQVFVEDLDMAKLSLLVASTTIIGKHPSGSLILYRRENQE